MAAIGATGDPGVVEGTVGLEVGEFVCCRLLTAVWGCGSGLWKKTIFNVVIFNPFIRAITTRN